MMKCDSYPFVNEHPFVSEQAKTGRSSCGPCLDSGLTHSHVCIPLQPPPTSRKTLPPTVQLKITDRDTSGFWRVGVGALCTP